MSISEAFKDYLDKMDTEEYKKAENDYFKKLEKEREKVSTEEYIQWVYDFVSKKYQADDERAIYEYRGIDSENGRLLSQFMDYVESLAEEQRVLVVEDDECEFENEEVVVNIKDKYFRLFRMFGQGTWTLIRLLEEEPNYCYVKI